MFLRNQLQLNYIVATTYTHIHTYIFIYTIYIPYSQALKRNLAQPCVTLSLNVDQVHIFEKKHFIYNITLSAIFERLPKYERILL